MLPLPHTAPKPSKAAPAPPPEAKTPAATPEKAPPVPPRPEKPPHVEEFQISGEPAPAAAENTPAAAPPIPLDKPAAKTTAGKSKEKPAQKAPPKPAKPAEPELEREQEYELVLEQEQLVPAYDQKPPEPPAPAQNKAAAPPAGSAFESDRFPEQAQPGIDRIRKRCRPGVPPPGFVRARAAREASDRRREPAVPARARVRTPVPARVRARPAWPASAELFGRAFPWICQQ